jgi:hypothetical protein
MFRYWREIFWQALKGAIFTVWDTPEGIFWSCLVLVLTVVWLWRKHGLVGMRSAIWATLGEGLLIASVAFILVFIWQFINKPHEHWKAENERANLLDKQKKSVEAELVKERDRNRPKFEIVASGTSLVGNDTVAFPDEKPQQHTGFFLPIIIYNQGQPSVIRGIKLSARFKNGKILAGRSFIPSQPEMIFPDVKQRFPTSSALIIKGTSNPIVTGGQCDGFIYFLFPPALVEEMLDSETVFTLEVQDVTGNWYSLIMPNNGVKPTQMSVPPSMLQGTK